VRIKNRQKKVYCGRQVSAFNTYFKQVEFF